MAKNENSEEKSCPECESTHLTQDYKRGELICEDCGLVLDNQYIDDGPEWRSFNMQQENNRARTGSPMTQMIHDKGLSTSIDFSNKDYSGRSISDKSKVYRLRKWHRRVRVSDAKDRNISNALRELNRLASMMDLPKSIRENAAVFYRRAVEKNLIRGRSIDSVVASTIYAACRKNDVPRTLDEISNLGPCDKKEIGRTYRFISRELRLKIKPTDPKDYLNRFCSELKLKSNVKRITADIIDRAREKGLISGKGPTGIAASALYIGSIKGGERRTQREIAEVAGVTEVTIRNRYKEMLKEIDMEIDVRSII